MSLGYAKFEQRYVVISPTGTASTVVTPGLDLTAFTPVTFNSACGGSACAQ